MWPSIILLLLLFFVFLMLFFAFAQDILIIAVNALIIYLVSLRSVVEIKKGYQWQYTAGAILSALILFLWTNIFPLWQVTTFVFQAFIIAQAVKLLKKGFAKKTKRRK